MSSFTMLKRGVISGWFDILRNPNLSHVHTFKAVYPICFQKNCMCLLDAFVFEAVV